MKPIRSLAGRGLLIVVLATGLAISLFLVFTERTTSSQSWVTPVIQSHSDSDRRVAAHHPLVFDGVKLPAEIAPCLDSTFERVDLLATAGMQGRNLYLLAAYRDFATHNPLIRINVEDELIVLHQEKQPWCERLAPTMGEPLRPINVFVPTQIALSLEVQRYQHWIEQTGGKAMFQKLLNQQLQDSVGTYLLSELQIKALQQLGIKVNASYRLLTTTTFT